MPEPATPEQIRQWVEKGNLHRLVTCDPSVEGVEELLENYPDKVNEEDRYGCLPLHNAVAYRASAEVINLVFEKNKSAAQKKDTFNGWLPLHIALRKQCGVDVAMALLVAYPEGAKVKDNDGRLPLHLAVELKCEVDLVKALFDAYPEGAKEKDNYGYLPLHFALQKQCGVDVVMALLDAYPQGATGKNEDGELPLHFALKMKYGLDVVKALLAAYPDGAKEKDSAGVLPLEYALLNKCGLHVVEALLVAYPDGAKEKSYDGKLPIHIASSNRSEKIDLKALIDAYPEGAKEKDSYGNLPLKIAVSCNRGLDVVKALLDAYPEGAKEKDDWGKKLPLHTAVRDKCELDVVKALLEAYPEGAMGKDEDGQLPIHIALSNKRKSDVVKALIDAYPDGAKEKDREGLLPLHTALSNKSKSDVVKALLDAYPEGAKGKIGKGDLPLHIALSNKSKSDVVKALIDAYPEGAKEKIGKGDLPLHIALSKKFEGSIVKGLLDAYPDGAKEKDREGLLPLHTALKHEFEVSIVKALLDAYPEGAKEKIGKGDLPLHIALSNKSKSDVVKALIDAYLEGAKEKDNYGNLPLHFALMSQCGLDVVKALLDAYPEGATGKNEDGQLPIHIALSNKSKSDVVKALMDAYPDGAKGKDREGLLPLHTALSNKSKSDVVKALLDAYPEGAKEKIGKGDLPLHIALSNKFEVSIVKALLDAYPDGAKAMDNKGWLPLNYAIQTSLGLDEIKLLIEAYPEGVSKEIFDGRLPLHYAIQEWRDVDVIKMLIEAYPVGASTHMFDGRLPFVYAIEENFPADILFALLEADMPVRLDDGSPKTYSGSWNHCVSIDDELAVDLVTRILSPGKGDYWKHIHSLAEARDADGRKAVDMAKSKSRKIINDYLLFCRRFQVQVGPLEHLSLTSILLRAQDLHPNNDYSAIFKKADKDSNGNLDRDELEDLASSLGLDPELFLNGSAESESTLHVSEEEFIAICKRQLGDGPREVVIKFMLSKDHWERERDAREGLNSKYVVSALTNVPSDMEFAEAVQGKTGGLDIIKEKFLEDIEIGEHVIVMNAADRNLQQIFYQERPKIGAVREILRQVFEAVNHLHGKKLMHGDLKMLNIVRFRIDNLLRLIDFDASAEIVDEGEEGASFAGAKFSSAILPPEMIARLDTEQAKNFNKYWDKENDKGVKEKVAPKIHEAQGIDKAHYVVKSFRTVENKPVSPQELPYDLVPASENIDAWSLGVLAYTLLTGESLIPSTRDDDCASGAAMHLLHTWGNNAGVLLNRYKKISNKAARDLVKQLLEREPEKRPTLGELLEEHPFFNPTDESVVSLVKENHEAAMVKHDEAMAKLEEMNANILVIKDLTSASKLELAHTCEVLLKAIYEATEVKMPTCFIILSSKLPKPTNEENEVKKELLDHFAAKADGSGVEFKSKYASLSVTADGTDITLAGDLKKYKEQVDTGMKWIKRIKKIGSKVAAGKVDSAFDIIKEEIIQEQLVGEKMYFYLVDQLTGEPVQAPGYPIEITSPSDLVPKLLPLMQVGMRAMSIYNGTAGIARMFGFPFPKVPKEWSKGTQESIEMLKKKSSVEEFGVVQNEVEGGKEESKTVRGASLRDFMDFMEKNDPGLKEKNNGNFAGLQRIGDPDDGTALWTTLTDPKKIEKALKERSRQRREEELKQAQIEHGQALEEISEIPKKNDESTEPSMTNEENDTEPTIKSEPAVTKRSVQRNETGNEEVESANDSRRAPPATAASEVAPPAANVYQIHCCHFECNIM